MFVCVLTIWFRLASSCVTEGQCYLSAPHALLFDYMTTLLVSTCTCPELTDTKLRVPNIAKTARLTCQQH